MSKLAKSQSNKLTLLRPLTPNGIILILTFLVISIDNRTDFVNLGKRTCKENSLDNSCNGMELRAL